MAASTTIFDNRELALLFWLLVLVVIGFISERLRRSVTGVLKGIFAPKLITILVLLATYAGLLVCLQFQGQDMDD